MLFFSSWMVIEFYTKYFVFLLRTNIPLFFFSSLFCPDVCPFLVKPVCSEFDGWPFWLKSCWIVLPPSDCPLVLEGGNPRPYWWEGAVAGCMRLYWKRNLCCSNSFFCCSLDCQDVLNISVLWAWCFNKKKIICATALSICPSFGQFILKRHSLVKIKKRHIWRREVMQRPRKTVARQARVTVMQCWVAPGIQMGSPQTGAN